MVINYSVLVLNLALRQALNACLKSFRLSFILEFVIVFPAKVSFSGSTMFCTRA